MWTVEILVIIASTFLFAGFVKGLVGLGLPTVSLAILTATIGLKEAMVLMLLPSLLTNIWQGIVGGAFTQILRRLWSLLLAGFAGTWLAVGVLAQADTVLLTGFLGIMLCVYAAVSLATPQIPPPGRRERWITPVIGGVTGILTGLVGSFVIPAVPYFHTLGWSRNVLVQAMGIWFTVATLSLAVGLGSHRLLPAELGGLSAVALVPAFAGMWLGQQVRGRMSEGRFRQVLLVSLFILGVYIAGRSFL
jgi:uncharacterized membrane protein YfcA